MSMSSVLSTITPIATSVIAGCALVLTFRSSQDNRDKLRLDLFNRRFSIYQRVLVFYKELNQWHDKEEQIALIQPFIEASREALFIFPKKSGVYEYLQEFLDHAFQIVHFRETLSMMPLQQIALYGDDEMKRQRIKLETERMAHGTWMLSAMDKLEKLMKPSMSFERL